MIVVSGHPPLSPAAQRLLRTTALAWQLPPVVPARRAMRPLGLIAGAGGNACPFA